MLVKLKKFDKWLHSHCALTILLCLLVLLRIPNFFEPYWYGDEGIYLTLGTAMRHGERLYAQIIDHKTPLIYYLAMVPNQFDFRILLTLWMIVSTIAFYSLAHRLIAHKLAVWFATFAFILLTTLPMLEGNIPNGELFVMGFVLVGGAILSHTGLWKTFFDKPTTDLRARVAENNGLLLLSGAFFGLGVLTKVPGVFDFFGFASIAWFSFTQQLISAGGQWRKVSRQLATIIRQTILLVIGLLIPIALSVVYFIARGSGHAYLDYGLLYNFRYVESWSLPFSSPLLVKLFTLPGKAAIAGLFVLGLTVIGKWLKPSFKFISAWLILSVFASLLSNRPYPHYLLQMIPPLAFMIGLAVENILLLGHQVVAKRTLATVELVVAVIIGIFIWQPIHLLGFGTYPTVSYYQRWYKLVTHQMTLDEYNQSFDSLMHDNYTAAKLLNESPNPYLFIWGTNPTLYALSQKVPTGRFTVSFHIRDFNAYDETLASIKERKPEYIVVMKDETQPFPEFFAYLTQNYIPNANFTRFTLWKLL